MTQELKSWHCSFSFLISHVESRTIKDSLQMETQLKFLVVMWKGLSMDHALHHKNVNGYDCDVNGVATVLLSFRFRVPEHSFCWHLLIYLWCVTLHLQPVKIHAMHIKSKDFFFFFHKYTDNYWIWFNQSSFSQSNNFKNL